MPLPSSPRQPDPGPGWFASLPGQALLDSEAATITHSLQGRGRQPWLWLAPTRLQSPAANGAAAIRLGIASAMADSIADVRWQGTLACDWPLPVAGQSLATVVVQHVGDQVADPQALVEECGRILMPGGQLLLLALNPLSPYRWRWTGRGPGAAEPFTWRRRLRVAGLVPAPVSSGLGPRWQVHTSPIRQHGAGLRAAFLLQAEKRELAPITPAHVRALRWQPGLPAA